MRWMIGSALLLACCARTPSATPQPELELFTQDADVWTYAMVLRGHAPADLARCEVDVDRRVYAATLQGSTFSAQIDVPPAHESLTRARCRDVRGNDLVSRSVRLRGMAPAGPTARLQATLDADGLRLDARASTHNESTRATLDHFEWYHEHAGIEAMLGTGPTLSVALPREPGEHRYQLLARDANGQIDRARVLVQVSERGAQLAERGAWIDQAVVYGVVPPLYGQPPLQKVTAALDDLHELGADALWLSPIFRTTPDDFGYAVTDSFTVREDYGSETDLEALTRAAHARDMRVLLDLVINHSAQEHRYYREAEALHERSHYFGFYDRDADGQATHYFDWKHLPNFAYQNEEVVQWSLAWSRTWIARGIDGYRVDAAWGVRERTPSFYPRWSAELRRVNPDVFLLAEASARDPYYLQNGFDAAYDWTHELGHHAWEHVFDAQPGIAKRLIEALTETARTSPSPERTFRFLNNNDTGERFITKHGLELTRVATAALLTLPGIPCLYALDERGAAYQPYEEAAPKLSDPPGLRELHRSLIALRHRTPALRGAGFQVLANSGELLVFARSAGDQVALVALNFAAAPAELELTLPAEIRKALGARAQDALGKRSLSLHEGRVRVALEGWGMQVLLPAP